MKPYFAKYLPVEGEIKEGDIFETEKETYSKVLSIRGNTCKCIIVYGHQIDKEYTCHTVNLQKKFKLFLCSRDNPEYKQEILTEGIKEGQEFTKEEKDFLTLL